MTTIIFAGASRQPDNDVPQVGLDRESESRRTVEQRVTIASSKTLIWRFKVKRLL